MDQPLYAVIMAGGSGTRFWPASRSARPKQFLPISGGQAMIAETYARLEGLVPAERVLVVTAASQAELVREALPMLPAENVLAEPEARNTAPCIGFAAHVIHGRDPNSVQVILPADHVVRPLDAFQRTLRAAAAEAASADVLLTFGIRPDHPATGYGYIESGQALATRDGHEVLEVARFVEKPDLARAEEFLASGRFLWNSGMFVWSTAAIQKALAEHVPDIHGGFQRVAAGEDLAQAYGGMSKVPIDTGVMEKATNVRMLPIDYHWSDVGSWAALPELHTADAKGNFPVVAEGGLLVTEDAEGCLAFAEGEEVVALVGVQDLVVVRSGNATLVCPRDRAQDVKSIVEQLRARADGKRFL